jgi:hypothetical protein
MAVLLGQKKDRLLSLPSGTRKQIDKSVWPALFLPPKPRQLKYKGTNNTGG